MRDLTGDELKEIALKAGNYTIVAGMQFAERFDWDRIAADVMAKVNAELGDASNEAEKEARRQKALTEIYIELGMLRPRLGTFNKLDAIIKIAQG